MRGVCGDGDRTRRNSCLNMLISPLYRQYNRQNGLRLLSSLRFGNFVEEIRWEAKEGWNSVGPAWFTALWHVSNFTSNNWTVIVAIPPHWSCIVQSDRSPLSPFYFLLQRLLFSFFTASREPTPQSHHPHFTTFAMNHPFFHLHSGFNVVNIKKYSSPVLFRLKRAQKWEFSELLNWFLSKLLPIVHL